MKPVESILQRADMEVPRSPRDLCDWVDAMATELSQTQEGRKYARSGAMLPKKLWEEIRPLGLFAHCRYGTEGVICTPNLSNDNYDGQIAFAKSPRPPIFVELTYAKDGYDERLRLKVLSSEGTVSAVGRLTVSGTKASGHKIEVENESFDHVEVRTAALTLVKERLAGKSNKQYGATHVLVVVVDDYLPFRTEEDQEVLMTETQSIVTDMKLDFGAVYLLGSSGRYCARVSGEI